MRRVLREGLGAAMGASVLISALILGSLIRGVGEVAWERRLQNDLSKLEERSDRLGVVTVVRYPWGAEVRLGPADEPFWGGDRGVGGGG